MQWVAGVDEAGRGPLAGPVFAAAVILDPERPIVGLKDSKQLTKRQREKLVGEIKTKALAWSLGQASVAEIDAINILQASLLAMQRAVLQLSIRPQLVLVDGNRSPALPTDIPSKAIIKGDQTQAAISAASILAKVARDAEMLVWHQHYPHYGFNQHQGYGTALHLAALQTYGATPIHRRSFAPVRKVLGLA